MPEPPRLAPVLARGGDVLFVVLPSVAASVAMTGGIRSSIFGIPLSVTSAGRPLMAALVVLALRHLLAPRPSLPARIVTGLTERRQAAAWWVIGCVALVSLQVAVAQRVGNRPATSYSRLGEPNDGGYLVCGNLLDGVQAGYSYGISGYDGWGCEVATRLGVTVHQYDCFNTLVPVCSGGRTQFHPECIADRTTVDEGRPFDTLENQVRRNGDGGKRIIVKMDVEGAEWESLLQTSPTMLERVDQLVMEFHGTEELRAIPVLRKLKKLFYVAHLHFNNFACDPGQAPFPSWAYEVTLVNRRLAKVNRARQLLWNLPLFGPRRPHPLDRVNNPKAADCR
jgi:hypothetical protein